MAENTSTLNSLSYNIHTEINGNDELSATAAKGRVQNPFGQDHQQRRLPVGLERRAVHRRRSVHPVPIDGCHGTTVVSLIL